MVKFKATKEVLDQYGSFTRIANNHHKSGVAFSKSCHGKEELERLIGIGEVAFPIKYLGHPLMCNKLK